MQRHHGEPAQPIELRTVEADDLSFLDPLHDDEEYAFFAVNHRPARSEIERQILEAGSPAVDFRIVCNATTGEALGWIRADLDFDDGNARLGYGFARQHWGQGYAASAVRIMVDALFDRGDIHKVWARVDPRNERSMKVLQRAGLRLEGTQESHVVRRGERVSEHSSGWPDLPRPAPPNRHGQIPSTQGAHSPTPARVDRSEWPMPHPAETPPAAPDVVEQLS